jgi:HEAT repeat protein
MYGTGPPNVASPALAQPNHPHASAAEGNFLDSKQKMSETIDALLGAAGPDPEAWLADPHAAVRRAALLNCAARYSGERLAAVLRRAMHDADATVRREAVEQAGRHTIEDGDITDRALDMLSNDPDILCREAAAFALGEIAAGSGTGADHIAMSVAERLQTEREPLVREAIAAALGAIGEPRTLNVVIGLTQGEKPAVRRRAVVALAAFEAPAAAAAMQAALCDRDKYVREAAEWLLGE